jgi:outer membrane lipoprotein-sorting protein
VRLPTSIFWPVVCLCVTLPATALADRTDEAKLGKDIAAEADRRARGFGDFRSDLKMELSDRRGQKSQRLLNLSTFEDSETEKSLVTFTSPRDIRGTALLTYSHRNKDDDQWLYLPALRRSKRIAASNRSSPFMGSEFAYEDLSALQVSDYDYRYLGEEVIQKSLCFVIERTPTYEGSGYSKQKVWLDQAEYRVVKIDYWDKKNRKLKTLIFGKYAKYGGDYWKPGIAKMLNLQTRAVTTLWWSNYRFQTGLKRSDFDQSALRRVR